MIFLLLIEGIFRRDLNEDVKQWIYNVALVCIVLFAAFIICNDIVKLPFFVKMKL